MCIRLAAAPNVTGLNVAATLGRTLMVATFLVYIFRRYITTNVTSRTSMSRASHKASIG